MWRDKHAHTFALVLSQLGKAKKINKKIFLAILISHQGREVVLAEYWLGLGLLLNILG